MSAIIECPTCDGTGKGYRYSLRGECVQRMTGASLGAHRPYCRDCAGAGSLLACSTCDGLGMATRDGPDERRDTCLDCDGLGGRQGDSADLEPHGVYTCCDCGFRAVPPYFVAGNADEPFCCHCVVAARKTVARLEAMP